MSRIRSSPQTDFACSKMLQIPEWEQPVILTSPFYYERLVRYHLEVHHPLSCHPASGPSIFPLLYLQNQIYARIVQGKRGRR
jgi:hypothetical protein